jgi:hypothetical protein
LSLVRTHVLEYWHETPRRPQLATCSMAFAAGLLSRGHGIIVGASRNGGVLPQLAQQTHRRERQPWCSSSSSSSSSSLPSPPSPTLHRRCHVHEVTARDGIQNEKAVLTLEQRLELVRLVATQLRPSSVEVASFVRGDLVPAMARSAELCAAVQARVGWGAASMQMRACAHCRLCLSRAMRRTRRRTRRRSKKKKTKKKKKNEMVLCSVHSVCVCVRALVASPTRERHR